jgi:hypothetical protein
LELSNEAFSFVQVTTSNANDVVVVTSLRRREIIFSVTSLTYSQVQLSIQIPSRISIDDSEACDLNIFIMNTLSNEVLEYQRKSGLTVNKVAVSTQKILFASGIDLVTSTYNIRALYTKSG